MSQTYVEPIAQTGPRETAQSHPRAKTRWLRRIILLLVVLWLAAEGVSLAMQYTRLHRILTAQIAAAMGRPVEVRSYHFSFWDGAVIQARSVVVGEDPRFGAEYFLRADSMAVRLRWRSLLRGGIELGTLSLDRPSLNLVRNSSGDWNLAEWLPHPESQTAASNVFGPVAPPMVTHFRRIEIEGGRVNFKVGDEKLPFAFVNVAGTVETDHPGRWRVNLQATPWRAAVVLQQLGTIQVSGELGGTSSRLRPAAVTANWSAASLPDVLRLLTQNDLGVRGLLNLSVDAHTEEIGEGWAIRSRAQIRGIHRWDLAERLDNPAINLDAKLTWLPSEPSLEFTQATIEAPHSQIHTTGRLYWGRETPPHKRMIRLVQVVSSSADIDMRDLLPWVRAFHSGLAEDLSARGVVHVNSALSSWPPRLANATISGDGIEISGAAIREPFRIGLLQARYAKDTLALAPVNVSWGAAEGRTDGSFRMETLESKGVGTSTWRVSGNTKQARDLLSSASALGLNLSRGWDLAGPFACDLRWQIERGAAISENLREPSGWMEFGAPNNSLIDGAALHAPFLNLPIEQIKARVDLKPGTRQIKLTSAQAFGARWTGKFARPDPDKPWQFDLSADRLSTVSLDRWLNPRWRESFIDRVLPFFGTHSNASAAPENLQASGHIAVAEFSLALLALSKLQGDLAVGGRHITLSNATAQFYGGQVSGSFDANLNAVPAYRSNLTFARVDLANLTAPWPRIADLFTGTASAELSLQTAGSSRADLISNLTCRGTSEITRPELKTISLAESLRDGTLREGSDHFSGGQATFACANRAIAFQSLALFYTDTALEGAGSVDFGGKLNLKFQRVSAMSTVTTTDHAGRITGSLAAPEITPISSAPARGGR
jgi:AsmA-like C-terminal region